MKNVLKLVFKMISMKVKTALKKLYYSSLILLLLFSDKTLNDKGFKILSHVGALVYS